MTEGSRGEVPGPRMELKAVLSGEKEKWNATFDSLVAETWLALQKGDVQALERARAEIAPLSVRIDRALPPPGTAAEEVARALGIWDRILSLGLATQERSLADQATLRPGSLEQEILRILWKQREEALQRGEIHSALPENLRRTPARVHQVLESLTGAGLLLRTFEPGRGGKTVAHYQLFGAGVALAVQAFGPSPAEATARAAFGNSFEHYRDLMPEQNLRNWK